MKFLDYLKALFFPKDIKCIICDEDIFNNEKYCICDKCKSKLKINDNGCNKCGAPLHSLAKFCMRCKNDTYYFDKALSPFIYDGEIKNLIYKIKYANAKYLFENIGNILSDFYIDKKLNCDLIMYVPMHPKRQKKRGYNQAEQIANVVSKNLSLPISNKNLTKINYITNQTKLTAKQRRENIKNSFAIQNKDEIKDKNILLIDDVFTTGATTNEISKLLKQNGSKSITVLTVAHTDHNHI